MYQSKNPYMYGTGRRKSSVARVRLFPNGTGSITLNGRDIEEYFGLETLKMVVRQPLAATDTLGKVDIVATVEGGGVSGQAGALRHGISRALLLVNPEYRAILKKAGFLTRDPRMKERKKYGLKETKYRILMQEKPELAMRVAVRGMMPRNTVTKDSLKRLHVYAGDTHEHQAQKPELVK